MLKYNEVNPLNVSGLRRVSHCPPHFHFIDFDLRSNEKAITDWVYENLSGRFYFGDQYNYNTTTHRLEMCKRLAFEIPGELSYFGLCIDSVNKSTWDI